MVVTNVKRVYYLEDCTIEGYDGYFSQWKIETEGALYNNVLDFCQKYCAEIPFTKDQFLNDLKYSLSQCVGNYRAMFNIKSFYELEYNKKNNIWIYTVRRIPQNFV